MKILVNLILFVATTVLLRSALPTDLPTRHLLPFSDEGATKEEKKAASVLERMREVYVECTSYSDEGEVRTIFYRPIEGQTKKRKRTVVKPFETAYVRPDRFRFEFRDRRGEDEWNRYVVWQDDELEARSYWTVKEQHRQWPKLERALGAAAGVSSTTSRIIPWLLMGKSGSLPSMKRLELVGEDEVEGHPCWKVVGYPQDSARSCISVQLEDSPASSEPGVTTLWIDRDRYVLRRLHTTKQFENFSTDRTITYRPILGERIPRSAFALNPTK